MRRKDREMDRDFALGVLDRCEYAVLATSDGEGRPYCIPVTIVRRNEVLYIHSALEGQKVHNLRGNRNVCLTAAGDTKIAKDQFTTEFESAVVFGTAEEVTEEAEKIEALRLLCLRHVPTNMHRFDEAVRASLHRTGVWKIHMDTVTGKRKKFDKDGVEMKFGRME